MNKTPFPKLFALLLLSCLFLLPACQSQSQQSSVIDQQNFDRRIGVLKSLGGIQTSKQGTHLLMLNNGSNILLKSIAINLDDSAYRDKNVEVEGVLDYTTDRKQIMEVVNIQTLGNVQTEEILLTPSSQESIFTQQTSQTQSQEKTEIDTTQQETQQTSIKETFPTETEEISVNSTQTLSSQESTIQETIAGFSTFQNEGFGFSVQYPKKWYFSGSAVPEKNVIRHYEFGSKPIEEVPGSLTLDLMSGIEPKGQKIQVGNHSAIKIIEGDMIEMYVSGSKRIYRFKAPSSQQDTVLQMAASLEE